MTLNFGENLFQRRDVRETPAGTSTSTSSTSIIAPIGSIMAWLKSFANTPQVLPTGWMEADGSAINDADSVYDGQNAPDLNGGEFIRGAGTSGGTGGSDTMAHTHTTNVTIDNHSALVLDNHTNLVMSNHSALDIANDSHTHTVSDTTSGPSATELLEVYASGSSTRCGSETHTHTTSDTSSQDTHDHGFSQNIDAHSFSTNIDAHSFSTNIDAHTENNPATSAASNTENRPKYYNVVWIFRFK